MSDSQLIKLIVKTSRTKLKNGNYQPDSEELVRVINPLLNQRDKEQFLEPAAEFLWHMMFDNKTFQQSITKGGSFIE